MSKIPEDLQYTEEHEYIRRTEDPSIVQIGITDYAQGELGDIVYIELPEVGATFNKMDVFGTIEAVKAVSELFSPVTGEIVEINSTLENEPAAINQDPYEAGWMIKMKLDNPGDLQPLLDSSNYAQHIGE
jgi:glycine cleavage system H protein